MKTYFRNIVFPLAIAISTPFYSNYILAQSNTAFIEVQNVAPEKMPIAAPSPNLIDILAYFEDKIKSQSIVRILCKDTFNVEKSFIADGIISENIGAYLLDLNPNKSYSKQFAEQYKKVGKKIRVYEPVNLTDAEIICKEALLKYYDKFPQ